MASISRIGSKPTHFPGSPLRPHQLKYLSKSPCQTERGILLDHVLAGSGQLVGHRLDCHEASRPTLLALVVTPNSLVLSNCEVRRLDESPTQERIAVQIPRILFERVETHCTATGIAPHEFIMEAVSEKLASIHKEKRKKQRL